MNNLQANKTTSTEKLFYSPAFIIGFGDRCAGRVFRYPNKAKGPGRGEKSRQLAYERGRQYAAFLESSPKDMKKSEGGH